MVLLLAAAACLAGCASDQKPKPPGKPRKPAAGPGAAAPAPPKDADAVGDYFVSVVRARSTAETLVDQLRLRALYTSLVTRAQMSGGKLPATLEDLGDRMLTRAPGEDGQPYRYVPGQRLASRGTNVLAYEEKPVHQGGKVLALRVDGTIDLLTPADLAKALAETNKRLGRGE